jgi:hypothetical protein
MKGAFSAPGDVLGRSSATREARRRLSSGAAFAETDVWRGAKSGSEVMVFPRDLDRPERLGGWGLAEG